MKLRITVRNKDKNAERGFYIVKFFFDKRKDEFEINRYTFKCPEEDESCVYNTGSERTNPYSSDEGYVEFYFKVGSHSRESAVKKAMDKYEKFVAVWNTMGSSEAAGKAFCGRSKKEVDEESFRIQLEWHNKVFQ